MRLPDLELLLCETESELKKFLTYGWPKYFQLRVHMLYNMQHFITFEDFKIIFNNKLEGDPAESSFLKLKHDVSSNFGPIDRNKKYPPPICNKNVPS